MCGRFSDPVTAWDQGKGCGFDAGWKRREWEEDEGGKGGKWQVHTQSNISQSLGLSTARCWTKGRDGHPTHTHTHTHTKTVANELAKHELRKA